MQTYIDIYDSVRREGLRTYRRDMLNRLPPYPPVLDDLVTRSDILAEVPVGVMEIPLDQVIGTRTAGRTSAFSSDFLPILKNGTEFAYKWSSLYLAQKQEGIRDPIKAYEYMHRFYVQEGNKRVSVSKYVGLTSIMADVTRVVPRRTDQKENRVYYEFMDFFKVCPVYEIEFTEEGHYAWLANRMGQDLKTPWSKEAVQNLKAAYAVFAKVFKEKGAGKQKLNCSESFLLYLTFYRPQTLLDDPEELIGSRVSRLWNEFLTENNSENIRLVEDPEELKDRGSLLDIWKGPSYSQENPLKVAFVYDKNPEVSAWLYGHELGRNHVQEFFGGVVQTSRYDDCTDEHKIADAIDRAAKDKADIVITTSPNMMTETLRSAIHYPDMHFLNCSVNLSHNAVRTFYMRTYEAKFILGAVAASYCRNHKIGYLESYPIYGMIANINAFAVGAGMVDPDVRIYLEWPTKKGTDWRKKFREEQIHVISGEDMIHPSHPTREYGLFAVNDDGAVVSLAAPVWDWGKYYEEIFRTVLDGTSRAREIARNDTALNYWWGMAQGVMDVIVSDKLSYYTKTLREVFCRDMVNGSLNPFDGELHSQTGLVKTGDAPRLSNEEIITMNWLNDNVIGSIPAAGELIEDARLTVYISGVAAR